MAMQPRVPMKPLKRGDVVVSKFTGAKGTVTGTNPVAVKYNYKGKLYHRYTNPKYWKRG